MMEVSRMRYGIFSAALVAAVLVLAGATLAQAASTSGAAFLQIVDFTDK